MVEGAAGDEDKAVLGESTVPNAMLPVLSKGQLFPNIPANRNLPFLISTPPGPTNKLFCLEWAFLIEMAAELDTLVMFGRPAPSWEGVLTPD